MGDTDYDSDVEYFRSIMNEYVKAKWKQQQEELEKCGFTEDELRREDAILHTQKQMQTEPW